MLDILSPTATLGYCTNVHAGASLDETLANLQTHTLRVKQRVCPDQPMGVGLWLSADAAAQLIEQQRVSELRDWLDARDLQVFTLNGFPHGNFHDRVVKTRVYQPDWRNPARLDYTLNLITILAALLPEQGEGSISTLPIGWGPDLADDPMAAQAAAAQLMQVVHHLARVELDTGKYIHLDLEPEPGCTIATSSDLVDFFQQHLLGTADDVSVRGYLRICHDICHAAVMYEDQATALQRYRDAGLQVGKVQISSALAADLQAQSRNASLDALQPFCDERYLHQTVLKANGNTQFYEDLPQALDAVRAGEQAGELRTHFHVPIDLDAVGPLRTTRDAITDCLRAIRPSDEVHHFEVETYAWQVLPEALQVDELAEGIARELAWVRSNFAGALQ